ncbi:phiSA1p31-related protein [Streptomyces sp. NRRL S-378]|uniref:phiSA1p31-related protein n=1 Tax=Streptomyces sp. NRRL S-378 TaxID=1463904 RepID=UPI0004C54349|nr:phiSA1p31-related protein [Streptomyces sp. NRRL S-378]
MTFKVGDSVRHESRGRAEVTYGPYENTFGQTCVVVRLENGRESGVSVGALTAEPKFAIGDEVKYEYGGGGTLVAGPFKSGHHDAAIWVVEKSDGTHMVPTENSLSRVEVKAREIKVGDRVRVVRATYASRCHGRTGVVTAVGLDWRAEDGDAHQFRVELDDGDYLYAAEVALLDEAPASTFEHDGVTYDLDAEYRDKDGDTWRFVAIKGVPRGGMNGRRDIDEYSDSLMSVVDDYGPLTKI